MSTGSIDIPPTQPITPFNTNCFASSSGYLTLSQAMLLFLQLSGGTETGAVVFSAGLTSSTPILASNGTALLPALSFSGDPNTGIYNISSDNMGIATGGTLRWNVSTTNVTSTLAFLGQNGTSSLPSYSFASDSALGVYRISSNTLGIAAGGSQIASISSTGILVPGGATATTGSGFNVGGGTFRTGMYGLSNGEIGMSALGIEVLKLSTVLNHKIVSQFIAGSVTTPSIYLSNDTTSGFYRSASNVIDVAISGVKAFEITSKGIYIPQSSGTPSTVSVALGTGTATSTGLYSFSADTMSIAAGGVSAAIYTSVFIASILPHSFANGTTALPSMYLFGDTTTGWYRPTNNQIAITVSTVPIVQYSSSGVTMLSGSMLAVSNNVTQLTSNTTGVTCNGQVVSIKMFGPVTALTSYLFTLTNSYITGGSKIIGSVAQPTASDAGFIGVITPSVVGSGTVNILLSNLSAVTTSNSVEVNLYVLV
jgi:hypothetical protein